jgi:hypothetical protein
MYKKLVIKMGKVTLVLDDKLEEEFRKAVYERKGMHKGNMSESLEEAINQWIKFYHPEECEGKENAKR